MQLRLIVLAAIAMGLAVVVSVLLLGESEEARVQSTEMTVQSTDMVINTKTATVDIGTEELGRDVYFLVLAGGVEDSGLMVNGSPVDLVAAEAYPKRAVQAYLATDLTGTTAEFALAAGADNEYLAVFKALGYQPASTDPWITKRSADNDTLTRTLNVTVPANGAVLLHGKRYDRLSLSPAGTVIEDTASGEGLRGYWINDSDSAEDVSFTFETSVARNEKYASALILEKYASARILEKAASREVLQLSSTHPTPVRGADGLDDTARATSQACRDLAETWRRSGEVPRNWQERPVVDLSREGVVPGIDIRQPLQDAFDAAAELDRPLLFLPPTTGAEHYTRSGRVTLETPGTVLCAYGARLAGTDASDLGIGVAGDGTGIYGLTLEAPPDAFAGWAEEWGETSGAEPPPKFTHGDRSERGTWANHVIILGASDVILRDLTLQGAMRGGVRLFQASNVLIEGACIYRPHSDGIQIATGSEHVTVRGSTVIESGDDCVSIVTYDRDEQPRTIRDILIEGNVCEGSRTRGLTVIGGEDIDIVGNEVRDTLMAGILLYPSPTHNTYPVRNVTVERNRLDGAGLRGTGCANCGDIVVNDPGGMIENVSIGENDISPRDRGSPIRTGAVCAAPRN